MTLPIPNYHAYLKGNGRRANGLRELMSFGVNSISAGAHLAMLGGTVAPSLANVAWKDRSQCVIGSPSIHLERSGGGKSRMWALTMGPIRDKILEIEGSLSRLNSLKGFDFLEEATREALIDAMIESRIVAMLSTEGGIALNLLRSGASSLTKLLDAEGLAQARRSNTKRASVSRDHRFIFHLSIQPGVFESYLQHIRSGLAEAGVQNRMTFSLSPDSSFANNFHNVNPDAPAVRACIDRAQRMVEAYYDQMLGGIERPTIYLSKEAGEFLVHIDHEARAFAQYAAHPYLRNYIARHAERTLREAGVEHVFEYGAYGEIQLPTMQVAELFDRDSIQTFESITFQPPKLTKQEQYAAKLEDWLKLNGLSLGYYPSIAALRKHAANAGLTRGQFDAAIPILCAQNKVEVRGDALVIFGSALRFLPPSSK